MQPGPGLVLGCFWDLPDTLERHRVPARRWDGVSAVTSVCALPGRQIKGNCAESFTEYWTCLDYSNLAELRHCRQQQKAFDSCVLDKLGWERPDLGNLSKVSPAGEPQTLRSRQQRLIQAVDAIFEGSAEKRCRRVCLTTVGGLRQGSAGSLTHFFYKCAG